MNFEADSSLVKSFEPSPNFGPRRSGYADADMIILHYTGMKSAAEAVDWLTAAESSVSAHYLIDEAGEIIQMVAEEKRAWHAGVAYWAGEEDINSCSIGIEIQNPGIEMGYPDFPEVQIDAVISLCQNILKRLDIAPERVLAHSDVAPERKPDPGEKFPWDRLYENGVGIWVTPAPDRKDKGFGLYDEGEAISELQMGLKRLGYRMRVSGRFCPLTRQVVMAFQRHWRPQRVDGWADSSTVETLERLLDRLGHPVVG